MQLSFLKGTKGKIFKHLQTDGSVEDFKRLGLWNGGAYPIGAHSKMRWLLPYTPLILVIPKNGKSEQTTETVETAP